jgi:hypothetical protein
LLDKAIEQASFDQTLVSHPEYEFAFIFIRNFTQLVNANAGVSRSFFQR